MGLVDAAVARQKNSGGSTHRALNLASFRGSSELEFGCDAAYILVPDEACGIAFQSEKNRFAAVESLQTTFDAARQTFSPAVELFGLDAFDAVTPGDQRADESSIGMCRGSWT